jgi:hypothetical protein
MAKEYVIRARDNINSHKDQFNIRGKRTYSFDFTPWAEDNNTVTSVTWTSKHGQASITGQALASNVATAQIEATEDGRNLIEVLADTGTEKFSAYLDIFVRDPDKYYSEYLTDYC